MRNQSLSIHAVYYFRAVQYHTHHSERYHKEVRYHTASLLYKQFYGNYINFNPRQISDVITVVRLISYIHIGCTICGPNLGAILIGIYSHKCRYEETITSSKFPVEEFSRILWRKMPRKVGYILKNISNYNIL